LVHLCPLSIPGRIKQPSIQQKHIFHDAGYTQPYYNLALLYKEHGRLTQAETYAIRGLRVGADFKIYTVLADIQQRNQRSKEATFNYREALALAPNYYPALTNLANLLRTFDAVSAEQFYRRILDQNPQDLKTISNLAGLLAPQRRRSNEALFMFRAGFARVIAANNRVTNEKFSQDIMINFGLYLFQNRRFAEAVEPLERAQDSDPFDAPSTAALGSCYTQLQKQSEGMRLLLEAVKMDQNCKLCKQLLTTARHILSQAS